MQKTIQVLNSSISVTKVLPSPESDPHSKSLLRNERAKTLFWQDTDDKRQHNLWSLSLL